jgi:hypothetical protein
MAGHYERTARQREATAEFNRRTKRKYPADEYGIRTRLYRIWRAMHFRCYQRSHEAWERYGGRGITVCDQWHGYGPFREWALSGGYAADLTIDRIDNDRGYEPSNCRWITLQDQQRNRRDNIKVSAFGETKTAMEWSRDPRCQVGYIGLLTRLRRGEAPEAAITQPSRTTVVPQRIVIEALGEAKSPEAWAADPRCKVGIASIYWRASKGWEGERIICQPPRKKAPARK